METGKNEQVKGKRELLTERLRNKYPEKDFSDEENLFGQISDDYDDYDNIGDHLCLFETKVREPESNAHK